MTRFLKEQQQKLDLQIRDESKKGSPLPEKSSGEELFLCLDGLAVTEGYADVALAVDRKVIRQGVEIIKGECGQGFWQFLKGGKEILDAAFLRLCLADLLIQILDSGFERFVPGGKVIVFFLVGLLVESDVGVFVDVLLDGIGNDLCFFQ